MKELIALLPTQSAAAALSELTAAAKKRAGRTEVDALLGDRSAVKALLHAPDAKARKNAARLLGALGHAADAEALIAALARERTLFAIPSILLALGSVGGSAAGDALAFYSPPAPADETEQKHCREIMDAQKKALGALRADEPLPAYALGAPRDVLLLAPEGFAGMLCRELAELGYAPQKTASGALVRTGELQKLYRARCFSEALLPLGEGIALSAAAVAAVAAPVLTPPEEGTGLTGEAARLMRLPWRVELRGYTGDRAAFIRRINRLIGPGDNPSHYALELRVCCKKNACDVFLRAATVPDGRFAYRRRAIAASIAPATAACLARLAVSAWRGGAGNEPEKKPGQEAVFAVPGAQSAEHARSAGGRPRALDPFCGSGTLLIELNQRISCASLTGVDVSAAALSAARENAAAAHAKLLLLQKDARRFEVRAPYDIVLTNLPFGNRVGTHAENGPLYRAFVQRLPELLADGGVAVLYTMERRLLNACIQAAPELTLRHAVQTEAGGLLPWAFVLQKVDKRALDAVE